MTRLLVVSPGFHGYASSLATTFAHLGYEARAHTYDTLDHPLDRAAVRTALRDPQHPRARRLRDRITRRAVAALADHRPDVVVVVRGDLLGDSWWEALERSRAARVTWFYDELRRMRYRPERLAVLGPIATYSPADAAALRAAGRNAHVVPLGFDALLPVTAHPVDGVSLIGARYPNRERLLRVLAAAGVPVAAFGRDWSRHPVDVVRSGRVRAAGVPTHRALPRSAAYGAMRDATATLNLHADQDGFTMRTFEAPGVGAVCVSDRADVAAHYEVGTEALAFGSDDDLIDQCRRLAADPAWARSLRERGQARTLAEHTLAHRLRALETIWD